MLWHCYSISESSSSDESCVCSLLYLILENKIWIWWEGQWRGAVSSLTSVSIKMRELETEKGGTCYATFHKLIIIWGKRYNGRRTVKRANYSSTILEC